MTAASLRNTDVVERARSLARERIAPFAAETDRTEQYPWYAVEALREAGLMGLTIPVEYGGGGGSLHDAILVVEEMAKVCGATGRIAVESNMGAIGAIMRFGTESMKRLAADLVLSGDKPAICITEPGAGSAATEMSTRAVKKGDRYVINGKKHWITGAGVSKLHLIFARVEIDGEDKGIGGFVAVRGEHEGLVIGQREPAMGIRGIPEGEVLFQDLVLPEAMLVPTPGGLKSSFASLMQAYNAQRLGAATVALGLAEGSYQHALAYAKTREQFGRPICEFQGLQWMLADMAIGLAAARGLIHNAASRAVDGLPDMLEAAQAKIFTSDMAIQVTNNALQIFGAAGYSRRNPLERMARDARMFTISGGTAQVLRNQVAARILGRKLPQGRHGRSGE